MSDSESGEKTGTNGTQLIDRAVSVLRALGVHPDGCRMNELAAAAKLTVPTTHRIVAALERHGLVECTGRPRIVRLGLTLFALGSEAAAGTGLQSVCRPALLRLSAETGESLFLMVRNGLDAVCVDRQTGGYLLDSLIRNTGDSVPLGIGSGSLAILARLGLEEIEAVLTANTKRYAEYGLSVELVRSHIEQARRDGYVINDSLFIDGIAAVARAICPPGRHVSAAISVSLTSARLTPTRRGTILTLLSNEIEQIEAKLSVPPLHLAKPG